jgi:hypothetical protein
VLIACLGLPANAQAQTFQCSNVSGVPPIVRAEGFAEQLGDLVLDCTGGIPTPSNQTVPQVSIAVNLDVPLSSRVTATSDQVEFLEALLIVDEPNSQSHPITPILNCGRAEAPDNTQAGAGVCAIFGGGSFGAANTYSGTNHHPNVFQGRSFAQITGQTNQVVFAGVPIDPPGTICANTNPSGDLVTFVPGTCHRIIRITNIRGDATSKGVTAFNQTVPINASLIINPISGLPVDNLTSHVARVQVGLFGPIVGAGSVVVQEGFSTAFKPRSLTQTLANGIARPAYSYSGTPNPIQGINHNQNVSGAVYDTESAYTNSLGGSNGDNPFNPLTGGAGAGIAFSNQGSSNTAVGIANAGVADSGTRFALQFDIPAGASAQVPQTVQLYNVITHAVTGVMVLANTDSSGVGPFSPATGFISAANNNMAVYEVLFANPNALEAANIPVTLLNAPPNTTLHVITSYAPFFPPTDAARQASATLPVPRFINSTDAICLMGACLNVSPNQGPNSGPISVALFGDPILNNAQVKLSRAGFPDIFGTGTSSSNPILLTTTFDLTGAPAGPRDIVVTPQAGAPVTYPTLFQIVAPPNCSYEVGVPANLIPASGGSGDLVVTPRPSTCAWDASTSGPGITLLPKSNSVTQPFIVDANPNPQPRGWTIAIAGQGYFITQAGACILDISPTSQIVPVGGGSVTVNVTAPSGCTWSSSWISSWLSALGSASGSGNGSVMLQIAPNTGGPRSTTVSIFSNSELTQKALTISQGGSTCGATDVSTQVPVVRGAFLSNFLGSAYTQQVKLTNNGPAIPGPVYLVVDGLVSGSVAPTNRTTTCQSSSTSYMVLAAPNGLSSGQLVNLTLTFQPGAAAKGAPPTWTTLRVFSGTPSQ